MKLIDKDKVVEEIEKRIKEEIASTTTDFSYYSQGCVNAMRKVLSFLDTLEVKEIVDYEEPDLNPIFEEIGVEPDSKIAMAFRDAFYKGVDNFCKKKEV